MKKTNDDTNNTKPEADINMGIKDMNTYTQSVQGVVRSESDVVNNPAPPPRDFRFWMCFVALVLPTFLVALDLV